MKNCAALVVALALSACTINHSEDPKLESVLHKCFQTTDDAVVYETPFCPPQPGLSGSSTCVTIKYFSGFYPPLNLRQFASNSGPVVEEVNKQIRPNPDNWRGILAPSPKEVRILGELIWPTTFTIEGMRRYVNYEQGDIWIVTVRVRDGSFAGKEITLPWEQLMQQFPGDGGWITDYVQIKPFIRDPYRLQIDHKKMIPCEPGDKAH